MNTKPLSETKLEAEETGKSKLQERIAESGLGARNRGCNSFKDPQGLSLKSNGTEEPASILLNSFPVQNKVAICILSITDRPWLVLLPEPYLKEI